MKITAEIIELDGITKELKAVIIFLLENTNQMWHKIQTEAVKFNFLLRNMFAAILNQKRRVLKIDAERYFS